MKYEDICKIDRNPFDDDVLTAFYNWGYLNCDSRTTVIRLYLFHWYFQKFNELYGTDIVLLDEPTLLIGKIMDNDFPSVDVSDTVMEYDYSCLEVVSEMVWCAGFEVVEIAVDSDEWSEELWQKPKNELKKIFNKRFGELDSAWRDILWDNRENIKMSHCSLEEGSILILRNKNIRAYELFCEKFPELVKTKFKDEKRVMDEVVDTLRLPLYIQCNWEVGQTDSYKYVYIDMGHDGYNYLGYSSLNFHWIINCFIFQQLFEDLKVKIEQLVDVYPELRYVA